MTAGSPKHPWPVNLNSEEGFPPDSMAPTSLLEKSRDDTSLGFLTRRFAEKLRQSIDGVLDLNLAAQEFNIPKRRLYDITNVLEGIQLIKKKSKSQIQWLGSQGNMKKDQDRTALINEEMKLDELIKSCALQLHQMCKNLQSQRFAYLSYEDIGSIPSLEDQTVFVIKAPADTKLEVPHPEESFQVHLSSTEGPIEVFLCSDEPIPMDGQGGSVVSGGNLNLSVNDNSLAPFSPHSSFAQASCKGRAYNTKGISCISNAPSEITSSPVSASPVGTMSISHLT
ncbi:transcription factor E2F3 [Notolabrus celidotus]|uniref:transcription factor E2F3 n=1 Tax=Notolabrus celidotus TaxID=1203425 RepID=UPI0014906B87|nr:transcription factor E2F3 [Notolabrus celidotus]